MTPRDAAASPPQLLLASVRDYVSAKQFYDSVICVVLALWGRAPGMATVFLCATQCFGKRLCEADAHGNRFPFANKEQPMSA